MADGSAILSKDSDLSDIGMVVKAHIQSSGGVTVGDDFELIGWDFVSNPSTHGAFMTPMNESKQMVSGDVCGSYCKAHDLIREIITELS